MDSAIFNAPIVSTLAKGMKAIAIAPAKEDPEVYAQAFEAAAAALREGELVCILPEGRLTRDGQIAEFRPGLLKILKDTPVPVIPMALVGLWGSMFSRYRARLWQRLPRRLWHLVAVNVGAPVPPAEVQPALLHERVQALYAATARA